MMTDKVSDFTRLTAFLEAMPDAMIMVNNQKGHITMANNLAEKLFGYTRAELIGQEIEFLIPARYLHKHQKHRQQYFKKPHTRPMGSGIELYGQHKDGHEFPVEISLSPIKLGEELQALAAIRDITKQKLLEEKLILLAQHDALTGLINRPFFEDRLVQAITLAKRHQLFMAVFFLDLDGFKQINDVYGHAIGDAVLCAAAQCMQKCIREMDTIARFGGDEFAIILLEIKNESDVIKVAKKILDKFSKGFLIANKKLMISLSIGISLYPKDGHQSLIEKADAAMYYVKKHGKNNFKLFSKLEE